MSENTPDATVNVNVDEQPQVDTNTDAQVNEDHANLLPEEIAELLQDDQANETTDTNNGGADASNAADVDAMALAQAPPALQVLPLKGPTLLSLRSFKDGKEQYESTMLALGGIPQAAQPMLWQPWEAAHAQILSESRPVADLKQRFGTQIASINKAIAATGRPADNLRYLPLMARQEGWTVLIDAQTIKPVGFMQLDSF